VRPLPQRLNPSLNHGPQDYDAVQVDRHLALEDP
jgi:hypothetical protein